jgi:hypothetical protein
MPELPYYTCEELINELRSRTTFAGIIFASQSEVRNQTLHKGWDIFYPNLTEQQVSEILLEGAEHFRTLAREVDLP